MSVTGSSESWLNPLLALPRRKLANACASLAPELYVDARHVRMPWRQSRMPKEPCVPVRVVLKLLVVAITRSRR